MNAWKRIVLDAIGRVLVERGFRKKGSAFLLAAKDVVLIVEMQGSQASTNERMRLTVNLASYSPELSRRLGDVERPSAMASHWRARLGMVMPEHRDLWWEVSSDADANRIGEIVARALVEYGLTALEQVNSLEKLCELWASGQSPGLTSVQRQTFLKALEKA